MNCQCKCKLLGVLEQKIMEVLWTSITPLKPSQVLPQLDKKYAYTTVMTVLKRMSDKKILKRVKQANSYIYSPILSKNVFVKDCLDDLINRLHQSYGDIVSDRFLAYAKNH
jgi:predicted transcriptional regulator